MTEYLRIYEKLKDDIVSGIYAFNDKLPSKRVAADRFNVSVITVQHAYELLEDEGYIHARQRSGYFVVYDEKQNFGQKTPFSELMEQNSLVYTTAPKNASETKPEPSEAISAVQTSTRDAFPFSVYAKAVRTVLSEYGEKVLSRSFGKGTAELRSAICHYLARSRSIHAEPQQIVVGSGSEHLYGQIIDLLGRFSNYGIEDPSYGKISSVYKLKGVRTEPLKLQKDGISSNALWQSNAGVLHISPYRSYPSGVSACAAKKREYIRFAKERGAWIIEDDFESEFSPASKPEETLFAIDSGERVIYVNSFTMTISPGIRVAYIVLPKMLLGAYDEKLGFCACTVPTLDQLVLARLLNNGDFERHINRCRRKMRRKKNKI